MLSARIPLTAMMLCTAVLIAGTACADGYEEENTNYKRLISLTSVSDSRGMLAELPFSISVPDICASEPAVSTDHLNVPFIFTVEEADGIEHIEVNAMPEAYKLECSEHPETIPIAEMAKDIETNAPPEVIGVNFASFDKAQNPPATDEVEEAKELTEEIIAYMVDSISYINSLTPFYTSTIVQLVPISKLENREKEWYEQYSAPYGSHLWWLLKIARDKARKGEQTMTIREAFDTAMTEWVFENEEPEKETEE